MLKSKVNQNYLFADLSSRQTKTMESISDHSFSSADESEETLTLLKKREMGDKVVPALKIDIYDAEHPRHALNSIKNIPLVKRNSSEKDSFRKNLQKAHHLDNLNVSVQRAAAKSQLIKLSSAAGNKLRKYRQERVQAYRNQA